MAVTIIRPNTHEEWLELRATGIGSSDIGTILGQNPFETPYQLWLRKTGQLPRKEETIEMQLGHLLEPAVASLYEQATGNIVQTDTEGDWCARNDKKEFLIASPDRICTSATGEDILLELKTTRRAVDREHLPKSWVCQVQYLMYVTEIKTGALAWLKDGHEFDYIPMKRNDDFLDIIIPRIEHFWEHCVKKGNAPEPINGEDIALMFPQSVAGKVASASDEIRNSYDRLIELQKTIRDLTAEKNEIIDTMKLATGDAEKLMYGDKLLGSFRRGTTKSEEVFDVKSFKEQYPDLYSQFTKEYMSTSSRTFYANYK